MDSVIQTIKNRYSVRSYSDRVIEQKEIDKLQQFLSANTAGPFNNPLRFQLLNVSDYDGTQLKELGVYGMIKGAKLFIGGAVKTGDRYMEDFGYAMEKNILFATSLGLNTCWIGGTLNRTTFGLKMNIAPNEMVPGITPIGYVGEQTIRGKVTAFFINARKRKKPEELFFLNNTDRPLLLSEQAAYTQALTAVRLAPSASNFQPWRIIKQADTNTYHFYQKENKLYHRILRGVKLQNIDMGIAMCHFELTAQELGLKGKWEIKDPQIPDAGLNYILTWVGKQD